MPVDKAPKEYSQSAFQKILDRLNLDFTRNAKKQAQDLYDTSEQLKESISNVEEELTGKIEGKSGEKSHTTVYVPVPENLRVFEFGGWGFAYVDVFTRFKYPLTIRGYEFFGEMNEGFEIHEEKYTQGGTHFGGDDENYLDTQDPLDIDSYILNNELAGFGRSFTLENVTQDTSGTILLYGARKKYQIYAPGVKWNTGDVWRIQNYPRNKLFSIGSLCVFSKRFGNIYVKARSVGKGHSYSDFTVETSSEGFTSAEKIDAPRIVPPIHSCGSECTLSSAYNYRPRCPNHGVVPWSEIISGTRETDHLSLFGVEFVNVELMYEEVEDETLEVNYWFRRFKGTDEITGDADETDLV